MTENYLARALLLALLCTTSLLLSAQNLGNEIKDAGLQLTISAGSFSHSFYVYGCGYGIADWKDVMSSDICATAVWEGNSDSSGCVNGGPSLEGKILMVWAGTCPVATKAKMAQEAGASALLVVGRAETLYAPVTGHGLGNEGEVPAVQIPVFYLSPEDFQDITPVFSQTDSIQACLKRPGIFLNSGKHAAWEIQQHCKMKLPTPFQFSVNLSNISGTDLQNVTILGRLLRQNGQELYTSTLQIPEIDSSVTDSLYVFPDVFDDFAIAPNAYRITYEVQGKNNGAIYVDKRTIRFNTSTYVLAKEVSGVQAAYRPDTLPQGGWSIGNIFHYDNGFFNYFISNSAQIAVLPGFELDSIGEYSFELALFRFNDDVLPDFSNFNSDGTSMVLVGTGIYTGIPSENVALLDIEVFDLNTAELGTNIESGAYYALVATFLDHNRYIYQGFSEEHVEGLTSTIQYKDGSWYLGNLYGEPNPVLRMRVDLIDGFCPTIDTEEPSRINFKTFPNPARSELTIQMALQETSDIQATISDMTGRILMSDNRQVFSEEQLTFPVSQLPNGAYSIRVTTKAGSLTKKFIVQKE